MAARAVLLAGAGVAVTSSRSSRPSPTRASPSARSSRSARGLSSRASSSVSSTAPGRDHLAPCDRARHAGVAVLSLASATDASLSAAGIGLALVSGLGYATYTIVAKRLLRLGHTPVAVMGARSASARCPPSRAPARRHGVAAHPRWARSRALSRHRPDRARVLAVRARPPQPRRLRGNDARARRAAHCAVLGVVVLDGASVRGQFGAVLILAGLAVLALPRPRLSKRLRGRRHDARAPPCVRRGRAHRSSARSHPRRRPRARGRLCEKPISRRRSGSRHTLGRRSASLRSRDSSGSSRIAAPRSPGSTRPTSRALRAPRRARARGGHRARTQTVGCHARSWPPSPASRRPAGAIVPRGTRWRRLTRRCTARSSQPQGRDGSRRATRRCPGATALPGAAAAGLVARSDGHPSRGADRRAGAGGPAALRRHLQDGADAVLGAARRP